MANQSVRMSRADTLTIRSAIAHDADNLVNVVRTPTAEAVENYRTINNIRSTDEVVALVNEINGTLVEIKSDYVTESEAIDIAKKQAIIFG